MGSELSRFSNFCLESVQKKVFTAMWNPNSRDCSNSACASWFKWWDHDGDDSDDEEVGTEVLVRAVQQDLKKWFADCCQALKKATY